MNEPHVPIFDVVCVCVLRGRDPVEDLLRETKIYFPWWRTGSTCLYVHRMKVSSLKNY